MGSQGTGGRRRQVAGAALAALVTLTVPAAAQTAPQRAAGTPSLSDLLARAGAYAQRFQQEFAVTIADERQEQLLRHGPAPPTIYVQVYDRRRLSSEILFLWVPGDQTWLTARNVRDVDGRAVTDSAPRLQQLLADTRTPALDKARQLRDEGARFNIGPIGRNFSDPTLALQFLHPDLQPRFTFTLEGRDSMNGAAAWKLRYAETTRPTLIASNGRNVPAAGDIWIARDGSAILRTRLRLNDDAEKLKALIQVDYRRDARFDLWLPEEMNETYEQRLPIRSRLGIVTGYLFERIDCVSRYENFRRFETSVRMVPPDAPD